MEKARSKIRWTPEEKTKVFNKVVEYMVDHHMSVSNAAVVAQNILPEYRRRPESSIYSAAYTMFGEEAAKEVKIYRDLDKVYVAPLQIPEWNTPPAPAPAEPEIQTEEPLLPQGYNLREMARNLCKDFEEEVFQGLVQAWENAQKRFQLYVEAKESPAKVQEERTRLLKIAVVGGFEKGADKQTVGRGLAGSANFRFYDNQENVKEIWRNDIIVIRTSYANHPIIEEIEKAVKGTIAKIYKVEGKSAILINDWITTYLLSSPEERNLIPRVSPTN